MIKVETFYINDREFTRTYSDEHRFVVRDGVAYEEACDPSIFGRTYIEGDPIPNFSESDNEDKAEAYDILMGDTE